MSDTAVLLCSGTRFEASAIDCARAVVVHDLCNRPADAAATLRSLAATRVVLGLCDHRPSGDLVHALRRAGAEPFGIESVVVGDRDSTEATAQVAAAVAKLDALPPEDVGKPALGTGGLSRRALLQLAPVVVPAPVAMVDDDACAGSARCGLCAQVCPEHAIGTNGPRPVVDPNVCSACGVCVPRCPQNALRLSGSGTAQLEAQLDTLLRAVDGLVLACRSAGVDAPPGWAIVELPTLGLVSVGWLLQLHARGADVLLAPCADACCAGVREVEALAARILESLETPQRRPGGRLRLGEPLATVDAVTRLAPRGATSVFAAAASPLGVVSIDVDRCTLCGACSAACPTNALQLCDERAATTLRHEPGACVACDRCVAACPEDALAVEHAVDVGRLARGTLELARAAREACVRCGAELPPAPMRRRLRDLLPVLAAAPSDLCAACAARHSEYDRVPALPERST